jgi:hypothetical protein
MVGDYEKPSEPSTEVGNMVGHASLFSQMLSLVDRQTPADQLELFDLDSIQQPT